ncbi:MAG: chalcone isomerase family protein [Cytophagales bacterium]|nr:chalcone isomerase family protein [Rhizobacter sp.]
MTALSRRSTLLGLACLPLFARAQTIAELPNARLLGQGRLTYFGLNVYGARLWVTDSFKAEEFARHPMALELEYARSLVGQLIAERSLDEMKKVGDVPESKAAGWLAAMAQIFPDVNKGDRITGVYHPVDGMRFFLNGKARGEVQDPLFARLFVGIWLSPRTSEPKLRLALLGTP